jgi:hypothetical protein
VGLEELAIGFGLYPRAKRRETEGLDSLLAKPAVDEEPPSVTPPAPDDGQQTEREER